MTPRTSTYLRRLALATLFAGAATLSASAFGDPAVACALPPGPVGHDLCVGAVEELIAQDLITAEEAGDMLWDCCVDAGGVNDVVTGACDFESDEAQPGARPGAVGPPATAATRQPAPPAPWEGGMILLPGTTFTQIPPGPAAPPPGEAAPAR